MKRNKKFLTLLLTVCGVVTACGSASNPGSGQTANKSAEPAKPVAAENKKTAEPSPTQQEELAKIIDGREERTENEGTQAEKEMVGKEYKSNEAAILKSTQLECDEGTEEGVSIVGMADGAFTKPNSKQKVYLYERCRAGRSFGIGGILIVEDGKSVSHYSYGENGLDAGIISLPDINKNGVSEIGIVSIGTGQGYTNSLIFLWEMKEGKMDYLGNAEIYDDNSGAMGDDAKVETNAYKISVQPGASPVFYREHYQQKGGAKKWNLIKKAEKFTLKKDDMGKYVKIN